jgi:hypothetical protein
MVMVRSARGPRRHGEPVQFGKNRKAEHESRDGSDKKYDGTLWGRHT